MLAGINRGNTYNSASIRIMIPTLVRRLAQPAKEAAIKSTQASNFPQTKKVWPPNFKELSHQQQLRFEKKYKRRVSRANYSPRWDKGVKYAQLATITGEFVALSTLACWPL